MPRMNLIASLLASLALGSSFALAAEIAVRPVAAERQSSTNDWPGWRGPQGTGIAHATQQPPLKWSDTENVIWKITLPGRGHSSPTVFGDLVVLTTAEEEKEIQAVICFDRSSGQQLWRTDVHQGGMDRKGNKKTTQASASVTCDGERLIVNFLNQEAIYTTALDLQGKQVWQTRVSDFATHQGFGSSPFVYGDLVYVTTDNKSGGVLAALDRKTGKIQWTQSRPQKANYASPIVLHVAGRDQLFVQGCDLVSSFDPLTGKKLWETEGATTECVTTIVADDQRIFVTGGYPRNHIQAVLADGSTKTAWQNNMRVYVPSMIAHEGYLYALLDAGVATCWKCDTGEEMWKQRLGGTFSASLVLVGDNLFGVNEGGQAFIFKANPKEFVSVGENQLGDEVFATPTICGNRIYLRVADHASGQRQEYVYCLGKK